MNASEIRDALACGLSACSCHRPGTKTHCPAHDDRTPSLDVSQRPDRVLVICRSGCRQADVLAALESRGLWRTGASASIQGPRTLRDEALALAASEPWMRPEIENLYRGADAIRGHDQSAARMRQAVTRAGESDEAWEVLAHAAYREREARRIEAKLDVQAEQLQRRRLG